MAVVEEFYLAAGRRLFLCKILRRFLGWKSVGKTYYVGAVFGEGECIRF